MDILPNWPESLGLPLNSGYKHTLETVSATGMTAGVDRPRRTIDTPTSEFNISFIWTPEQLSQYRQFARTDIDGTAGWFVIPLWSGGSMEPHTARIKTGNKYQLQLPYWSVSFVLECRERYRLPDNVGDPLLEWTVDDLISAGNLVEKAQCQLGEALDCYGGWSVISVASAAEEGQCNLYAIFKDWDTC